MNGRIVVLVLAALLSLAVWAVIGRAAVEFVKAVVIR